MAANVATLIMTTGTRYTFSFQKFETDSGHIPTVAQLIQEELRSPGVDGVRYLDDHLEIAPFQAATLAEFADYNSALQAALLYYDAQGFYGQLTFSNAGATQQATVKVMDVQSPGGSLSNQQLGGAARGTRPRPRSGSLVNGTPGFTGLVEAVWMMRVVG